jgi:hypothetical protein
MMRRTFLGAAVVSILLLLGTSRPASAQGLSSLAAAMASNTAALEKKAGCWGCGKFGDSPVCEGGFNPGFFNCQTVWNVCTVTSGGCGTPPGLVMIDPDGATQYVSRGSHLAMFVGAESDDASVRRNCIGLIVARNQSAGDIADVRNRTGILSL